MSWNNVKLVLHREVRDQLRDRRTLFMIAVLPLLLYPLLGMSMFQVLQFVSEHPTRVEVIGAEQLPASPELLKGRRFAPQLFSESGKRHLLEVTVTSAKEAKRSAAKGEQEAASIERHAKSAVQHGEFEAVVYFPPDFARRLQAFRESLALRDEESPPKNLAVPSPEIYFNTAKEKSQITHARLSMILDRWRDAIGRQNLATSHLPESAAKPFKVAEHDVAKKGHRDAAVWSKLLPFLLLIWALTGAFYPAIDLCAGEKERGTLETLLSSPAERSEIVWGKLLTVMLFSMVSAILNLISMGVTGSFVVGMLSKQIGPPPLLTPLWLLIALLPMSALFSALCLALAAFARSSKEGQYYLMPLMLVTMPLVILPMAPGVELTLGNSLIPVTGVVLLLRAMLEGNYLHALPFVPPVAGVTLGCCLWAIRWAIDQFNSENVLFRESERLDIGLWLKHLMRDRGDTPSAAMAIFCGVLILMVQFFMSLSLQDAVLNDFHDLLVLIVVSQLAVILTPALLMTVMLTRAPRRTLLLQRPPLLTLPAAGLLAIFLHPANARLGELVQYLYPLSSEALERLKAYNDLFSHAPSLWILLSLMAVLPALSEELAFRGFILSGLRHIGHKWWAIAISSVFFGISHPIFQQSVGAVVMGLIIGYLAVQSGSIFPCMLFHLVHNSITMLAGAWSPHELGYNPLPNWIATEVDGAYAFCWPSVSLGLLLSLAVLAWFRSLPYARTAEETLQDALEHQSPSHVTAS